MDGQKKMDAADSFSYCDISSVFITKTIERIISPMAVQLCHLIISLECNGPKHSGLNWDLEKVAEDLSRATEHFAHTAIRLSAQCDDKCLRDELDQTAKSVVIIGKNMLLTVQKLCIQPTILKHQEEFIIAAQNILLGILKILQLEDEANVRKICQAADWVLDCLIFLQTADTMPHLLTYFIEFSEALLLLNSVTERRMNDVKDSLHREHLSGTLQTLKKCVPMLHTATQSNIKHRQNDQMMASKEYVFDLASKTTRKLKFLLTTGTVQYDQVKKKALFSQQIYDFSGLLTNACPAKLLTSDIDFHVGTIVFHAMFVADCSRQNIRLRLVRHCHRILELRKLLFDQLIQLQEKPPLRKPNVDLEQVCSTIKEQLEHLNYTLVCAILYLILDNFTNTKDPLKKLLKASLKARRKPSFYLQHPFALKAFHPLLQAFHSHSNQLLKVANLVSAQCSEDKSVEEIRNCTEALCKVRDEVISLFVDASKTQCVNKIIRQAHFIYQRWAQVTENLLMSFDDMVTIHEFLDLSATEMAEKRHVCEKLLGGQKIETFHHQAADLCGLSQHVVQVINRYVDQSKDPIFRNGLRVLARQFESSVAETRTSIAKCAELISSGAALGVFLEKTKHLFETFHNVQQGVNGYKHPDLMSPLRTEIQSVHRKPIFIDFSESAMPQEDTVTAYLDPNVDLFSHEGFLSKPLPLTVSSSKEILSTMNNIEVEQHADLHSLVNDLIMAVKKPEHKGIHTSCSALIHIANTYIEAAKELFPPGEAPDTETVINYKDTEKLASHLLSFINNNGAMNSSLSMDNLIQTAMFLTHHIEHLKLNLILLSDFWYNFCNQLFCSPSSIDLARNSQTFNRTMKNVAAIVHLICECNTESECTLFSGKKETLIAIQTKLTTLQGIGKHLLTKECFGVTRDDKALLESNCLLWSVTIQQLLKSIDDFTGSNISSIPESINLAKVNVTESQSFVFLCETSLWLQETAKIYVANCLGEGTKDNITRLMAEVTSATETILKLRDTRNMSSGPGIFLEAECLLLQRELFIKSKLLMYHLNNIYQESQYSMHNVVDLAISLTNTLVSDKIAVTGVFEKNSCLLIDNLTFLKEMLDKALPLRKHAELIFLAEHLFFLTSHILTRAKALLENGTCWTIFIIEAMSLNWLAKANQLTLHLQLYTDLDDTTLALVQKCLKGCGPLQPETTDKPVLLETGGRNNSTSSTDINLSEQNKVLDNENKAYIEHEQSFITSNNPNVLYIQKTCDVEESEYEFNYAHGLCQRQQSFRKELIMSEQKEQTELHEQKRRIISSNKTFILKHKVESNIQQLEMCNAETLDDSNKDAAQTDRVSDIAIVEQEGKCSQKESTNQKTQNFHKMEKTNEPIVTFQKELKKEIIKDQELSNEKTHIMPTESEQNIRFEESRSDFCKDKQETACWLPDKVVKIDKEEVDCKKLQVLSFQEERETPAPVEPPKIICVPQEYILGQTYNVAKCPLTEEVETWEGESNVVVQVAREMAAHMSFMTQYLSRKGPIKNTNELIASAKCIATHGLTFVRYVRIMAKNCIDKRSSAELLSGMAQIQTIGRQLSIISSVKAATGCDDSNGEDVLVKNAQNLIHSVLQTWKAAEAACLANTGSSPHDEEEADVAAFCAHLRKRLCDRSKELTNSNT